MSMRRPRALVPIAAAIAFAVSAPQGADRARAADEAIPAEYGVRWEEPASNEAQIAEWIGARHLKPADGYRVEFWQREHDAASDSFFFRLRTMHREPPSFQVIKKVRVGDACTYVCAPSEGDQVREIDETLVRAASGDGFAATHVCSTSCERDLSTRPEHVTSSPPCSGGPAEVDRWKVKHPHGTLHLERWSRGGRVLWELSAKSADVSETTFRAIAAPLLAHGVQPLPQSKRDWMCDDAAPSSP
jgi:hypothetical protein